MTSWPDPVVLAIVPESFRMDRLLANLIHDDRADWRTKATIIQNYMPPFPDKHTRPKCVVQLGESFLRHSRGPRQGHDWDIYGDDYQCPELALMALLQADPPPWVVWSERNLGPFERKDPP